MSKTKEQLLSEVSDKKVRDEILERMTALCLKGRKKKPKDVKPRSVKPPESLIVFEREEDQKNPELLNLRWFYSKLAYDFSTSISISLSSANPASQLNLTNLKRLAICKLETKVAHQIWLINLSEQLVELEIVLLHFNSAAPKPEVIQIDLANLRSVSVVHIKGTGKLKLVTPELSALKINQIVCLDACAHLMFPEKVRHLVMAEHEPSMEQFRNLEILECDDQLPDDLLTKFENLKQLKYPALRSSEYLLEFLPKKERILQVLNQKKRLRRMDLEIVFYGVLLEDERQLDFSKDNADFDLVEFYLKNYARLSDDLGIVHKINYSLLTSFLAGAPPPDDFHLKFGGLRQVKVTNAVDDAGRLLCFLSALRHPVSLHTIDTNLDSTFYEKLADSAEIRELEIFHSDKHIDLCKIAGFNFLLKLDSLQKFSTNLTLSLEHIETLLNKFTGEFSIRCKFRHKDILIERINKTFSLLDKFMYKKFDSLSALVDKLAKK